MFNDNIIHSYISYVWFIDIFAIYFSDKQADGGSSIDFLLPVILAVVLLLTLAGLGMFLWKKEKCSFFRKKGNIIIEVDVILLWFY